MFRGSDGQCHHGLDQNIVFGLTKSVPKDFVWGVGYNSRQQWPRPDRRLGSAQDSLNVGLAPKTTTGLNRYQDSIFWDTPHPRKHLRRSNQRQQHTIHDRRLQQRRPLRRDTELVAGSSQPPHSNQAS